MKVICRQKIDGRVPVFPAASTHLCFTPNRPSRHNEVFLFVFLNCVVCSRLLWAASFGSLFVLLCGSWCSPGRKKKPTKKHWPCCWCNLHVCLCASVSVRTQSGLGLFRAASLLWADQLLQRTQTFCVPCGELVPLKEMRFQSWEWQKWKSGRRKIWKKRG